MASAVLPACLGESGRGTKGVLVIHHDLLLINTGIQWEALPQDVLGVSGMTCGSGLLDREPGRARVAPHP
ncbi:hypothetical protein HUA78_24495 [Myxococcus sp. CA033]|nr:hypothetical protein [Myxococcus sp. CA033]